MKNVNLTGLYLDMITKFNINGFEISSITPKGKEPIDALISFKGGMVTADDISAIDEMVYGNISGDVKSVSVTIKENGLAEVYIEFLNSDFDDNLLYGK